MNKTDITEEITTLDSHIAAYPDDTKALYRRGTLHWRLGHRKEALTDLNTAAALDPAGPAQNAVAFITGILDFTNPQNP